MNYYQPRQREKDKRWDFTCMNDGRIWPVGYCRAYKDLEGDPIVGHTVTPEYLAEHRATQHKHHADGHATEDEARACYREYLLDHHLQLMLENPDVMVKCLVCGVFTTNYANCDHVSYSLCPEHNNRAEVEKLVGPVGDIVSSW